MRKYFVAGNWKMNGTKEEVSSLLSGVKQKVAAFSKINIAVFPSFVFLDQVSNELKGSNVDFGAQNLCEYEKGAYTGEVSGFMLKDFECDYVLIGHSERRHVFGESNEVTATKFMLAQANGLIPVLCVGETQQEREANQTDKVVFEQIEAIIAKAGIDALKNSIIAYEPVWAIGTGLTATPEQAQEVHAYIREMITKQDADLAENLIIVYGGSVKGSNAAEIFAKPDVDGGLIGGASLKPDDFATICEAAENLS